MLYNVCIVKLWVIHYHGMLLSKENEWVAQLGNYAKWKKLILQNYIFTLFHVFNNLEMTKYRTD
jgi:hypothetical protein